MNFGSRIVIETIPALSFRLLFMTRRVSSPETPFLETAFAHFLAEASIERRDDFILSATSFAVTFTSDEGAAVASGVSVATGAGVPVATGVTVTPVFSEVVLCVHPQTRRHAERSKINTIPYGFIDEYTVRQIKNVFYCKSGCGNIIRAY